MNVYSNLTQHAITNSTVTDAGGKTTYQSVNVNGISNYGLYAGYGWKVKKLDVDLFLQPEIQISRNTNFINNLENINNYRSYNMNVGVYRNKQDKYSVSFSPGIGYTYLKSSLRPDVITRYFTSSTNFDMWVQLPYKFETSTHGNINIREKTDVFGRNRNSFKWDADVSKRFMKGKNLILKLGVYDILNQNIGFNRTATTNIITENSYNVIKRYFMLSLQYNLSKTP
jgi:hypothetical protein